MNVMAVVREINKLTADFAGMRVPVKVIVDVDKKTFKVEVGTPTTAALIIKELKISKGSGQPVKSPVGNLTLEQAIKIALIKKDDMKTKTLKAALKSVLGTALSMGVTVESKDPRIVQKEIDEGKYDDIIAKYESGGGE